MDSLLCPGDAETAAGEIALMLLLRDRPLDYQDLNTAVAEVLAGEGWHSQRTGSPITADKAGGLLGELRRRLRLLGLATQERVGQPTGLTAAGQAAAHTALRARALRPRRHPIG
jgi:hypothetical protein